MSFQPKKNEELVIDGAVHRVAEHPSALGMPYGQEGRQATVYQLSSQLGTRALKVFKPRYRRISDQVSLTRSLAMFSDLPGLSVCQRTALTSPRYANLLTQYPDLTGSVLMPWVTGPTWMLVVLQNRELTPEWSLYLASSLAQVLASMEARGAAHCDLSGPNILMPIFTDVQGRMSAKRADSTTANSQSPIEIVDVEQMYGPGLTRPQVVPAGSAGYAHRTSSSGLWEPLADRFAGALLIVEMLGWCDPQVHAKVWGDSYFDPNEMQDPSSNRYNVLVNVVRTKWGVTVADLFARTWLSKTLADCPKLAAWLVALPTRVTTDSAGAATSSTHQGTVGAPPSFALIGSAQSRPPTDETAAAFALQGLARSMEQKRNTALASQYYRDALALAPSGSNLHSDLSQKISTLESGAQGGVDRNMSALSDPKPPVSPAPLVTTSISNSSRGQKRVAGTVPSPNGTSQKPVPASKQASIALPTAPPPPPKQKQNTPGKSSYNAGVKAPSYALPPGVTSMASGNGNSATPVPFIPSKGHPTNKARRVPAAKVGAYDENRVVWMILWVALLTIVLIAILWSAGLIH